MKTQIIELKTQIMKKRSPVLRPGLVTLWVTLMMTVWVTMAITGCTRTKNGKSGTKTGERTMKVPLSEATQSTEPENKGTDHRDAHEKERDDHAHHSRHQEHRFTDPEGVAKRWNSPERDGWQHPKKIVKAMGIQEGMVVADIGSGTGYFLPFIIQAVGSKGRVIAVDIEPGMVEFLGKIKKKRGWNNLDIVHTKVGKTGLKQASVDRILMVNTWHHVPSRIAYAAHLAERLKKDGSVWIVDFLKDSPVGPPLKHRLPPAQVVLELQTAGFASGVHELKLPRQYVVFGK